MIDPPRSRRATYGVNTGFGELKNRHIGDADLARLQLNLLRSHAAGVGRSLSVPEVRALGALRANSLAVGVSGVRVELVEHVLALLNRGVHPVVPEQGSVGASGDLAPLAHFALVLVGEGRAEFAGNVQGGAESLAAAGLRPFALGPKEGLALINGTQLSTAILALVLVGADRVVRASLGAAALPRSRRCPARPRVRSPRHGGPPAPRAGPRRARAARAHRRQRCRRIARRLRPHPGSVFPALPAAGRGRGRSTRSSTRPASSAR